MAQPRIGIPDKESTASQRMTRSAAAELRIADDPGQVFARGANPADVRRGETSEAFRLAFVEFLVGAIITAGAVLAVGGLVYVGDRLQPPWLSWPRDWFEPLFSSSDTVGQLLQSIASTVITVASITFSLLLVAVQQSASSFTSQTFDQFLRRRLNQLYMGFFVGLGAYAQLQAASVHQGFVPVLGTTLAVVLTVAAVGLLLVLVYNTINQMRPVVIVEAIHDHLVEARARQVRRLVNRTWSAPQLNGATSAPVRSQHTGFVLEIDLDKIQRSIEDAGDCEVVLHVSIGTFVAYGDTLAEIRGSRDLDPDVLGEQIAAAIRLARQRNIDSIDAAYGLEQLETVGWTSISGAKHNPQAARVVVGQLRDVIARFIVEPPASDRTPDTRIVYRDDVPEKLMDAVESLAVVTADSQQHQVAADILDTMARLFRAMPSHYQERTEQVVLRTLPALASHPPTRALETAMERVRDVLASDGREDSARVVQDGLENLRQRIGRVDQQYTPR